MNAVIYARYSSDRQREESIEGQLRECTDYAMKNNLTLLGTYVDRALSARTADRPDFQRMIADSAKGLFDVVLVWKLDRFSRDRYDSAHYKRILKRNGVKVISAKENISDGPEGIILESMLEGYAEYYSAELSQKIQRGQHDNAMKCKSNGGNIPVGYVVGEEGALMPDPEMALVVQEIFSRYDIRVGFCRLKTKFFAFDDVKLIMFWLNSCVSPFVMKSVNERDYYIMVSNCGLLLSIYKVVFIFFNRIR